MKNKKIILLSMISFLTIALSLLIKSNITYGNEEKAYNFEDLKVGDYLPFGATIQVNEDYMNKESWEGSGKLGFYQNSIDILYYSSEESQKNYTTCLYPSRTGWDADARNYNGICYEKKDSISNSTIKQLSNYENDFNLNSEYIGWIITEITSNYIVLLPTKDYSKIIATPSVENDYTINTYFVDTNQSEIYNNWYLVKKIPDCKVSDESFWQNYNGTMHFLYKGTSQVGDTYTLTYTFEATAGDIVTFYTRFWSGATWYYVSDQKEFDDYEIKLNNDLIPITFYSVHRLGLGWSDGSTPIGGDQSNSQYQEFNIEVTKSGTQELTFTYTVKGDTVQSGTQSSQNYGYVKGVTLLTPINEGTSLDTSKVKDGDEILYRSTSETTNYTLEEKLTYKAKNEENIIENPNTGNFISIIILIALMILLMILIKYYPKKVKINKI